MSEYQSLGALLFLVLALFGLISGIAWLMNRGPK